jgi:DNA recombination protein RmuC
MTVALILVLLFVVLAAAVVLLRLVRAALDQRVAAVDRRIEALTDGFVQRLGDVASGVGQRLEGLDGRLLSTQRGAGDAAREIAVKLERVEGATAQMLARANELARLEQALRPPKARGGFGELLLENLLRDRLPPSAYEVQYGFESGERVDAVIRIEKLVPVDAKFPLDNFERIVEAQGDQEQELYEKAFARDVKGHVDAIATKYIRPGEGTYEFALMYVPAEAVYYELVCGKTGSLLRYAHDKRVFPVSPTTFTAYLQTIALGLKGMQIEQTAHEVMAFVAQLQGDFLRFKEKFELVGRHLGNARGSYADAEKRLDRFEVKLERASEQDAPEVEAADPPALPRAADAA